MNGAHLLFRKLFEKLGVFGELSRSGRVNGPTNRNRRKPRVVRVFVSSTFQGMQAERDELVKRAFPLLRKLCEERGIVWGEVDLRWGITDEQKADGKVLPVCLREVQRCRPYFIGILGQHYGSTVDEVPEALLAEQPWLAGHRTSSVTELEILHGVLNDPAQAKHAFFYFRTPAYHDGLEPEADERAAKLRDLKDRIRKSGLPVHENYPDAKALGDQVYQDFKNVIETCFAPEELDSLERETSNHEFSAESHVGVYLRRQPDFEELDEHADGDGPPLVVIGQSGLGKSALLANWALEYRDRHPEKLVLLHFIGSTPQSADWAAMLRRILDEFRRRLNIEVSIPDTADALRTTFCRALRMASATGPVVLVLDALNQLENREGALELVWLPAEIPSTIRLIASTVSGQQLTELKRRGCSVLQIEPLTVNERTELIGRYLKQDGRELSPARVYRIASAEQASNPLYLRSLLDELRLFGLHETLESRIEYYLKARDPAELFEKILKRYEEDYESERPGLVRQAMSSLWATRQGLSQVELLEVLGSIGKPLPCAYWSPLHLSAERALVNRSGLLYFAHHYMRDAVQKTWLATEDEQRESHRRLAEYFQRLPTGPRKVDELPWQLKEAQEWATLSKLLVQSDFLIALRERSHWDLQEYWTAVEQNSPFRLVSSYADVLAQPEMYPTEALVVSVLLGNRGYTTEALALQAALSEYLKTNSHQHDLAMRAAALVEQANTNFHRGDLDAAIEILQEVEPLCRECGDLPNLAVALNLGALILKTRGNLDEAMAWLKESEQINRQLGYFADVACSLGNQGAILRMRGDLDGAATAHREEERISRERGDLAGLASSLGHQALIHRDRGNLDEAMALHREEESLHRRAGNLRGLGICLGNQAVIAMDIGELDRAQELLKEEGSICRQIDDHAGLASNLNNQALLFRYRGNLHGALALHKEQEIVCRKMADPAGLALCLGNQANILAMSGDITTALQLHREEEQLYIQLKNPSGLARCLGNQATVLQRCGQLAAALELQEKVERMYRQIAEPEGLARTLANKAAIFLRLHDLSQAHRSAHEARTIAKAHGLNFLLGEINSMLQVAAPRQRASAKG
jgi:tetratricopeptide (TPR) repeat protein